MNGSAIAALTAVVVLIPLCLTGQPTHAQSPQADTGTPMTAGARMMDGKGNPVGDVAFVETPNGTLVQVRMQGLPPGVHGFHVHENGACEPPDFKSAGGHFNPTGAQHGFLDAGAPHAGDLPNIIAAQNGEASADFFTKALGFDANDSSLLPSGSKAVMVHATADDYSSEPAGASGDRIACGVIEQAPGP